MGKNEDPNLQQREQGLESGNPRLLCGGCCLALSRRFSNDFSFRCVFVLLLSLSVLLPGIFWILPSRSMKTGFDAKQAIKHSAPVHAYFRLDKPVSELVQHIGKLEYDIYEEIGVPGTKVAILSMHHSGASNSTDVVFGVLSDPIKTPINEVSLSVLRSSLIELFLQQSNLTLTTSIFGQPSEFEILKFPGGITVIPMQFASIWQMAQILFNFTLNYSIAEIQDNFVELKDQLRYGLHLTPYESVFVQLTNINGSTISSPVIVQASVMSEFGSLMPQRLKQLAQTITDSPAKNLGLNNTVFGKVKSISLSSYLKGTLHAAPPSPSPAPSPGPSISPHPMFPPTHSPALSPKSHHHRHVRPCTKCKAPSPSAHSPLHPPIHRRGRHRSLPHTSVSPAPSKALPPPPPPPPCPYSRPAVPPRSSPRSHSNPHHKHPPLMSPQSQLDPDLPPIPSVSYGSRPGGSGEESMKAPVSAPLDQPSSAPSPSSVAVRVLTWEVWLLGILGLIFHLLLQSN